jgi:hypothetical protein
MRLGYASIAICLWGLIMTIFTTTTPVDTNTLIISFAIVAAGAMAGGDGD